MLLLSGALIVGTGVSILDHLDDQRFADFHVIPQAVEVPRAVELTPQGPVVLNVADAEALERLPHVGPKTAAAIVESRRVDGPFASVDDLQRVSGIGAATVERLRPLVTTD